MEQITREEVIKWMKQTQRLMRAMGEMSGWEIIAAEGDELIAALQAAEPAAWLFPDMTWTSISAMGRDHKGKEVFALPCPPAKAQVPDEAFNLIEGIRAELTWPGWRKTSSRDWVMDSLSELLSMLTASPAPGESAKSHNWNDVGERCLDCGDKDWFAGTVCEGRQEEAER